MGKRTMVTVRLTGGNHDEARKMLKALGYEESIIVSILNGEPIYMELSRADTFVSMMKRLTNSRMEIAAA